jgi:hypothetical protein
VLDRVSRNPKLCFIRGRPLPGINRNRCRRLSQPHIEDDGSVTAPTFEPATRRWLGLDFDALPTPAWNPDDLARRREAILQDRAEHPIGGMPPKDPDDGEGLDFAVDLDPPPIDPVKDWAVVTRAAVSTLPSEFRDAHCWAQLTSSAGIADGVRIRLWFWLGRPVTDPEVKRWLVGSPVDLSLYNPVQPHYVAAPIFDPPEADPVARRSWMWWRHVAAVPVPDLPEPPSPPPPPPVTWRPGEHVDQQLVRRATAYAEACLRTVQNAPAGDRHTSMRSSALTLFGMVEHGLLPELDTFRALLATADSMRWPAQRARDLVDWCRAHAAASPILPEGFRP